MATALSWTIGTVLMLVEFGVLTCSALGTRRRSWFYIRLSCATLVMVALALGLAFAMRFSALPDGAFGPVWLGLLLTALAAAPVFCYDSFAFRRHASDEGGEAGPGSGPPPPPPRPPRGGPPLPDADQSRVRWRDHNRPRLRGVSPRRRAVEPTRPRVPAGR